MRVSRAVVILLAWMSTAMLSPDSHATSLLLGEQSTVETTRDDERTDTQQAVAVWDQFATWIWSKQREFHRALTRELRVLSSEDGVGWALVLMSVLYGVLHAAGPGHGKAV